MDVTVKGLFWLREFRVADAKQFILIGGDAGHLHKHPGPITEATAHRM